MSRSSAQCLLCNSIDAPFCEATNTKNRFCDAQCQDIYYTLIENEEKRALGDVPLLWSGSKDIVIAALLYLDPRRIAAIAENYPEVRLVIDGMDFFYKYAEVYLARQPRNWNTQTPDPRFEELRLFEWNNAKVAAFEFIIAGKYDTALPWISAMHIIPYLEDYSEFKDDTSPLLKEEFLGQCVGAFFYIPNLLADKVTRFILDINTTDKRKRSALRDLHDLAYYYLKHIKGVMTDITLKLMAVIFVVAKDYKSLPEMFDTFSFSQTFIETLFWSSIDHKHAIAFQLSKDFVMPFMTSEKIIRATKEAVETKDYKTFETLYSVFFVTVINEQNLNDLRQKAINTGTTKMIEFLLQEQKRLFHDSGKLERSALIEAVKNNAVVTVLKKLLKSGLSPIYPTDAPLKIAIERNNLKTLKFFFTQIEETAEYVDGYFKHALTNWAWSCAKFLLEQGADINGQNILRDAIKGHDDHIVNFLTTHGNQFNLIVDDSTIELAIGEQNDRPYRNDAMFHHVPNEAKRILTALEKFKKSKRPVQRKSIRLRNKIY